MCIGQVIKHNNFMDVCARVMSADEHADHFKLRVEWINMGYKESWIVPCKTKTNTQWIEIKKSDVGQWQVCTEQNPVCYRDAQWAPIESEKKDDI